MFRDRKTGIARHAQLSLWLTLGGAVLTQVLLFALPGYRWVALALALVCLGALAVFVSLHPQSKAPCRPRPLSVLCFVAAALLALTVLWQTGCWLLVGQPVPPVSASLTALGVFSQVLLLLCGGGTVVFLALCGRYFATGVPLDGRLAPLALAPVAWQWVRLLRYEMSYAGTGPLVQTLLVTLLLVSALLFWYLFVGGVTGARPPVRWQLTLTAAATALFGLALPVYFWLGGLLGLPGIFASESALGLPDMAVGLLALSLVYTLSLPASASADDGLASVSDEGESQQ